MNLLAAPCKIEKLRDLHFVTIIGSVCQNKSTIWSLSFCSFAAACCGIKCMGDYLWSAKVKTRYNYIQYEILESNFGRKTDDKVRVWPKMSICIFRKCNFVMWYFISIRDLLGNLVNGSNINKVWSYGEDWGKREKSQKNCKEERAI